MRNGYVKKAACAFVASLLLFSVTFSTAWAETRLAVINVNNLNVREGPGNNYPVKKRVNKGETYAIITQKNDWVQLRLNKQETGWVALRYVSETKQSTKKAVATADNLRIRSGPGSQYKIIGYIKRGQTVEVLEKKIGWTKVKIRSLTGWVSSDYLSIKSDVEEPLPNVLIGTVTADKLNVRAEPSQQGKIIGSLKRGEVVNVVTKQNSWYKVTLRNQTAGWVHSSYISFNRQDRSPSKTSYVKVLYDGTNIRVNPSLNSPIQAQANNGAAYRIIGKEGSWYKIELPEGTSGYIADWVVSVSGSSTSQNALKNKTIVLDAGHGGKDSGTVGKNGTMEKTLTLNTVRLLEKKLQAAGANVILTRADDVYITLQDRVKIAYQYDADIFISIHYDSSSNPAANGLTIYYYDEAEDKPLAQSLYSRLSTIKSVQNRGIHFGDFHVIRETKLPSVLLELGYLSNPNEELLVSSALYQEQIADAIFTSLAEYFQ